MPCSVFFSLTDFAFEDINSHTLYKFIMFTLCCVCVCVGSRSRKRELITISDDSDEEPVTLVPGSPVLVPDDADDDDVSILEVITF